MSKFDYQALITAIKANDLVGFEAVYRQVNQGVNAGVEGPMVFAVRHKRYAMLRALIDSPLTPPIWVLAHALIEALTHKDTEAEACLKATVDYDTALEIAAQRGGASMVDDLIAKGAT